MSKKLPKSMVYAIIAIVAIAIMALAYMVSAQGPVVTNGDNISVYYTGAFTNGTIFSTNVGQNPLSFVVGSPTVITGFGQAVVGMHINQTKTVTIPSNEAYGAVNPALIVTVPISDFHNETVQKGMTVYSNSSSQVEQGIVTNVSPTNVTVDFNPPLAGDTLIFNITVVKISNA
jgi:FKBP-type peptidyl-prolyl cis-trans isomerase 2